MKRNLYVALGDSITAGYGAPHPHATFVYQVSQFAHEQGLADHTMIVAQNGWTSGDLWKAVNVIGEAVWKQTNMITLMTGGNDLRRLLRRFYLPISGPAITPAVIDRVSAEFTYNMNLLCNFIYKRNIPYVIVTTVYNPIPHFPIAVAAFDRLNTVIRKLAEAYRFTVSDVFAGFQNREHQLIEGYRNGKFEDLALPFRRPIHPNHAGHARIAEVIKKSLRSMAPPLP
ncbi:lipase [Alicyclobacillus hesperidum subsp. aegles]|uniref:SGNH/GDSL hydrolase family protein n=1 Tax=Alicyclobacillus hesperidum TaxID=89784 RepID=UPI000300F495|nr:SGNH/GDSL hydrolase family protein [Alicyclobacillus hesperidum]GLG00231.1 lipase [Alicyclobacillus hesperidum subsp. aegles]